MVSVLAGHAYAQPSATPPTPPPPIPQQPPPIPQQPLPPQPPPREPPKHALCFAGRPYDCASVLLLELGARGDRTLSVTTGDVGLLIHDDLNAYGGAIGLVGISGAKGDLTVLYAARYRRYLGTWGLAGDVAIGYAGGPSLEVALGWYDVIAVTAGVNHYERDTGDHSVVAGIGLRIGAPTIGSVLYATALVATSSR